MLRTVTPPTRCVKFRINLTRIFCLILCLAFFTGGGAYPARADEKPMSQNQADTKAKIEALEDDALFRAAEEFARCAGVYEAGAKIMKAGGNDNLSIASHEKANGARLAGIWFAEQVTGKPDDFINEKAKTAESGWLGLFEAANEKDMADAMDRLMQEVTTCSKKYSKTQGEIVQKVRRAAYKVAEPERNEK